MLALRVKSHFYVTSNFFLLPKNIQKYFGANINILLRIVTFFFSLYVTLLLQDGFKSVLIKKKCVTYITSCYIRYICELHYINY